MDLPTKVVLTRVATEEELAVVQQMLHKKEDGTEGMSELLVPALQRLQFALAELEKLYLEHEDWRDLLEQDSLDAHVAKVERLARIRVRNLRLQVDAMSCRGKVGQS